MTTIKTTRSTFGETFWRPGRRPRFRGGAVADAFSPDDLAGLRLWLRADSGDLNTMADGSGAVAGNSDPVGLWPSKGGAPFDATNSTSSSKPTFQDNQINGLPGVTFDGVDDRLTTGWDIHPPETPDLTIILVYAWRTDPTSGLYTIWSTDADPGWCRRYGANSDNEILSNGSGRTTVRSMSSLDTDQFFLASAVIQSGETDGSTAYIDGALQVTFTESANSGTANLRLAQRVTGNEGNVTIAEMIGYDRALSGSDRQQVEAYLANKYGITLA